MAKWQTCCC